MTLRSVVAIIVAALGMFLAAGFWNLLVIEQLKLVSIPKELLRENPLFPLIILGYLLLSAVIYYVGSHSTFSRDKRLNWIIAGICIMETAFGFSSLVFQAYYRFPLQAIPLDIFWYAIEGIIGGMLFWLLIGRSIQRKTP